MMLYTRAPTAKKGISLVISGFTPELGELVIKAMQSLIDGCANVGFYCYEQEKEK